MEELFGKGTRLASGPKLAKQAEPQSKKHKDINSANSQELGRETQISMRFHLMTPLLQQCEILSPALGYTIITPDLHE